MAGDVHAWREGGRLVAERAWQERQPLQRAVRILLECILVLQVVCQFGMSNLHTSPGRRTVFLDDFNTTRCGLCSFSDIFVHRVSFFPDVHIKTFPK